MNPHINELSYHEKISSTRSEDALKKEIAFITKIIKDNGYKTILDIDCYLGQHSIALAKLGYNVTSTESIPFLLEKAKDNGKGLNISFQQKDITQLDTLEDKFDLILCLWQNFGFHGEEGNKKILNDLYKLTNDKGCLILDVYNENFYDYHKYEIEERENPRLVIFTSYSENKLRVSKTSDFEFNKVSYCQIFDPVEFLIYVRQFGFKDYDIYTDYDLHKKPGGHDLRMQAVFFK